MNSSSKDNTLPAEKLDRRNKKVFKKYMMENPFYMEYVLGRIYTEQELDDYIEDNLDMFDGDYTKYKRRRV